MANGEGIVGSSALLPRRCPEPSGGDEAGRSGNRLQRVSRDLQLAALCSRPPVVRPMRAPPPSLPSVPWPRECAEQSETVHEWHVSVDDDQGIGDIVVYGLVEEGQRLRAAGGRRRSCPRWSACARGYGGWWHCRRQPEARRPRRILGLTAFSLPIAWVAGSNCAVKQKELPAPTSLSTQIRPRMSSTNRLEMLNPNPVPP